MSAKGLGSSGGRASLAQSSKHRRDIDGLRAIAILGVLAFHFGLGFTGGYGGVDVFFVISGFLIAGILKSELEAGSFSIARFYVRRFRRILPAFTVFAVVTTVFAATILFAHDFRNYGIILLAAVTMTSNFAVMRETGYFDGAAISKPALHTWSLSVEEQFYVVFPILLFLLYRFNRKAVVPVLAAIAAVSLAVSVSEVQFRPQQAFFSTAGRAWELLCGVLLALGALPLVKGRVSREIEAALGLALIAFGYVFYSDATDFPGVAALPFCLGAALVLHSGQNGEATAVARVLSSPPAVGLGLISYSVYLFHWPLMVLARYRYPEAFAADAAHPLALRLSLAAASIALGYLSWWFVETPFRSARAGAPRAPVFAAAAVTVSLLAGMSLVIIRHGRVLQSWPADVVAMTSDNSAGAECVPLATFGRTNPPCLVGGGSKPVDTLLWGDSHAATLIPAFADYGRKTGQRLIVESYGGCPPLVGVTLYGRSRSVACHALNDTVAKDATAPKIKLVILAARWALYAEGTRADDDGGATAYLSKAGVDSNAKVFAGMLEATVKQMAAGGRQVVIVGPVPENVFNVPLAVARHRVWQQPLPPGTPFQAFLNRQRHVLPVLERLAQIPNVSVVYPHAELCDARACRYERNGEPLYTDTNHLSDVGLAELAGMFPKIFATRAASQ